MGFQQIKTTLRPVLRSLGLEGPAKAAIDRYHYAWNRVFHNHNKLFYTLSPNILPAITRAFDHLAAHSPALLQSGAYYEFGVFKGFSIWFAEAVARGKVSQDFRFFGFDSFEGLPETEVDRHPAWLPGNYAAGYEAVVSAIAQNGGDLQKIELVRGYYSAPVFRAFAERHPALPAAIAVIDCDIYESAALVLGFMAPRLVPGTILLMDDYNVFDKSDAHGERRALAEFEAAHGGFAKQHLFDFGWHGAAFVVTKGAA